MRCLTCQFENRAGVKFCEKCGAKMEMECPHCKAKIPSDRDFCGECGQKLGQFQIIFDDPAVVVEHGPSLRTGPSRTGGAEKPGNDLPAHDVVPQVKLDMMFPACTGFSYVDTHRAAPLYL